MFILDFEVMGPCFYMVITYLNSKYLIKYNHRTTIMMTTFFLVCYKDFKAMKQKRNLFKPTNVAIYTNCINVSKHVFA